MLDALRRFFSRRSTAYKRTFSAPDAQIVLADLARYCRAHEPIFHTDPCVAAFLEGRRDVWLRIRSHLDLSEEELFRMSVRVESVPVEDPARVVH